MNRGRVEKIKQSFWGIGPKMGQAYSNKEIVDESIELQGAIARDFAARMKKDISRDRDVLQAIEEVVEENDLQDTEEFLRFKANITELGYTIGTFIKGMTGERMAKKALKLISYDKGVRVLYNISLEDEDAQAEYDAIVIAPYGMFVIEVKNWAASLRINERGVIQREDGVDIMYDLPGRMSIKESLLREYLGDLFAPEYQGIVLFSNERAKVQDDYRKIPLSFGGSIVYDIREYGKHGTCISPEQVNKIADIILEKNKEQKTINKVNSEAIIEDYAALVVMFDEKVHGGAQETSEQVIDRKMIERLPVIDEAINNIGTNQGDNRDESSEERGSEQNEQNEDRPTNWWNATTVATITTIASTLLVAGISAVTMKRTTRL